MAHRGRLNVLANILRQAARASSSPSSRTSSPRSTLGGGDVKYHLGFSTDRVDAERQRRCTCRSRSTRATSRRSIRSSSGACAPSRRAHGDVEHRARARRARPRRRRVRRAGPRRRDAATCRSCHGYRTGGTVHVIVNNQIGFTASPAEQRSTPYCTDVAKMLAVPDLPRQRRGPRGGRAGGASWRWSTARSSSRDVVIDMYCYRKYGHNENDEPSFTQPLMYERIEHKESVREDLRASELVERGRDRRRPTSTRWSRGEPPSSTPSSRPRRRRRDAARAVGDGRRCGGATAAAPDARRARRRHRRRRGDRSSRSRMRMTEVPAGLPRRTRRSCGCSSSARQMGKGERPLDWGMAELLAYRLAAAPSGVMVRLSGQDCARGTFSHRHAVIVDVETGARVHAARQHLTPDQGRLPHLRRAAVGGGGARLRVRLLARLSRRARRCGRRSSATSRTARR